MSEEISVKDIEAKMLELRVSNEAREKSLHAQGLGITDVGVMQLRLKALLNAITGDDPELKAIFDLRYQEAVSEVFDEMESQANRARIMAPGPVPSLQEVAQLNVPGRR